MKPKGLQVNFARDPKGFTLTLQETRSIHDSMNLPKIEFINLNECNADVEYNCHADIMLSECHSAFLC